TTVYCVVAQCQVSSGAARALVRRAFTPLHWIGSKKLAPIINSTLSLHDALPISALLLIHYDCRHNGSCCDVLYLGESLLRNSPVVGNYNRDYDWLWGCDS